MLAASSGATADYLWNVDFDVYTLDGRKIDGARVFFRVNNGNLVQFGAERLPAAGEEAPPAMLDRDKALDVLSRYIGGLRVGDDLLWDAGTEMALPVRTWVGKTPLAVGQGLSLARVWQFGFVRRGRAETWRARIDATTGEVLELVDTNQYAQVTGGAWPVSWRVGNVKQNQIVYGWPFAKLTPSALFTSSAGLYTYPGSAQTASHAGNQYVTIASDTCGASSIATDVSGNVAWGTIPIASTPGNCTTPGVGGAGNTASSRQQYYQVNRMMEKGRAYLTSNTWLQGQIPVNVNINSTCNAFWNGVSLNFYRSGGGCGNTGEDSAVSLHEWGHGLDSNDGSSATVENGTGETYGDFNAALQLHDSCIGWGFRDPTGPCGGYGNACNANHPSGGACDGVRDVEWHDHADNVPWTVEAFTHLKCPCSGLGCGGTYVGPCGADNIARGGPNASKKEGHCESYVSSGALWDFASWDLPSGCGTRNGTYPDYNCPGPGGPYDAASAWQVVDRLWFLSRASANQAFTCNTSAAVWTSNGCNAGSNWKTLRAADDDDGDLSNGTPHSCELAAAFNRHGIACTTDTAWNVCFRGCTQPAAPVLSALAASATQVQIGWSPDPGSDRIDVLRNQTGCNTGFTRIANDVSGSSYTDTGVLSGTTYFYRVQRQPLGNEACSSSVSNCVQVTASACAGPSAPSGLTATATGANQASLSWTGVLPQPTEYRVYRAATSGGPYTLVGSVGGATTTLVDNNPIVGAPSFYVVRAFTTCESANSNEATVSVAGDCTTGPTFDGTQGVAQLGNGQGCGLRVSWNAATRNCAGPGNLVYSVYRATTPGFVPGAANLLAGASCVAGTSFDDTSAAGGTVYYYTVRAEDTGGRGGGACGGGAADGNFVKKRSSYSALGPTTPLALETFDGTGIGGYPAGWTPVTLSGGTSWAGVRACAGQSAPNVLRFGGATTCTTNYADNVNAVASKNVVVAAGSAGVTLNFWHRWRFETGFDGGRVMLSPNNMAANFYYVGSSYLSGQGYNGIATDAASFTGVQAAMVNTTVNLSDFCTDNPGSGFNPNCAGQTIFIAFNGFTDVTVNDDGWFVDNVTVTQGTGPACSAAPLPVSFLTATGKDTQVIAQWLNPAPYVGPTRLCRSTTAFAADPGATACPAPVNQTGAASTPDSTTFSSLTNGQTQFLAAFVGNASSVFSGRKTVTGYPLSTAANAKWSFSTNAAALAPPLQSSGIGLFAGSNDRGLYAMQLSGATAGLWPAGWAPGAMNGPAQQQPLVLPTSFTGLAFPATFVGSQDGFVYCFRADTGAGCPGWAAGGRSAALGAVVQATPMLYFASLPANRLLLVGTRTSGGSNALYALKVADGTVAPNWPFTNGVGQNPDGTGALGIISGPAFVDATAQRVYFTTRASTSGGSTRTAWAVNLATAIPQRLWSSTIGDVDGAFTQDFATGNLLVGTNSGAVFALNPANGTTVWSRAFNDGPVKDFIYYSSANTRLYFATTTKVWSIPASGATGSDWSVTAVAPSRPLLHFGTTRTYVGACTNASCVDGRLIELDSATSWASPKTYDISGAGGLGGVVIDRGQSPAVAFAGSRSGRIYAVQLPLP